MIRNQAIIKRGLVVTTVGTAMLGAVLVRLGMQWPRILTVMNRWKILCQDVAFDVITVAVTN